MMFSSRPVLMMSVCTALLLPSPAHATSWWEKLFGATEEEPAGSPPEVTLQAPFPTKVDTATASQSKLMGIYAADSSAQPSSTDLDQPHRSPDQISEWASGIVSQAMTISPEAWESDFAKIESHFTPFAAKEFKNYLAGANLVSALKANNMKMQAIADGAGLITKEGKIGETYHWLVQIPIMTSFYKAETKEVGKNDTIQNQNLIIQVQVGRITPKSDNDIGLLVERWHVSAGVAR